MAPRSLTVLVSARASRRREAALRWLEARSPTQPLLVLGESLLGAHDLLLTAAHAAGATMGWGRATISSFAAELAVIPLARSGRVYAAGARDAVVARALAALEPEDLGRFAAVSDTPGFVRAIGAALDEVRMAAVSTTELTDVDADLGRFATAVRAEWAAAGLADRADMLEAATGALADPRLDHPAIDVPTLLFDARIWTEREARFTEALLARSGDAMATAVTGDARTLAALARAGLAPGETPTAEPTPEPTAESALARLQRHLFRSAPDDSGGDESVTVFSAPGEGREAVEVARRLLGLARAGMPFDRCAVLLRQPEDYRPHIEEALGRADIPAYLASGVRRPDPAGRAFLALLRCRAEDYSALRFAEYLSIGEVPDDEMGAPPPAQPAETRWVAPESDDGAEENVAPLQLDLLAGPPGPESPRGGGAAADAPAAADGAGADRASEPGAAVEPAVPGRSLRVPRRWEQLLVEAAVVGGLDRWERRLNGLRAELELKRSGLEAEDADHPGIEPIERTLVNLGHLRGYALPLLEDLSALPEAATWAEWLDALGALATRALRHPHNVQAALAGLAPMGPVGPVTLDEVLRVLGPRLPELIERPPPSRYGRVFVGAPDDARGLSFDVVFVPGMAERVFPPKIAEEPILLDAARRALDTAEESDGGAGRLTTNADRVARERLALRLAVGAAGERVVLSYPRIEAVKARPRVPSFYALEAVRAAEGRLPRFEELAKRAEDVSEARIGWPAPRSAERAIDEAEYDLAVLDDLGCRGERAVKAAGHLLHCNPHLARALRFRAYRWEVSGWTWADGLIKLSDGARAALAKQAPDARAFSATALQHFAACPYRFYLQALQRLQPREAPVGIEELDPLQRGSLFHQVQFELLTRLKHDGTEAEPLLPVRQDNLDRALETLDEVLDAVADQYRDRLVPAIDRVWADGIEALRQDLREWLHRESRSDTPFEPWRFELSFGLPRDRSRDEHSVPDPVDLGIGLRLRGAIDLVERTPADVLRVTDHKTGRFRAKRDAIIQGGELLQPVLYGLAAQALFPDLHVASGRLYYCTTDGEFRDHTVPLDEHTTEAAGVLADVVRGAFESGRFPALPRSGACRWCDYLPVCGPDEERRIRRKPKATELKRLRDYQ